MAYRFGNRSQITFLPDSVEQYISEEDPVRAYDAFVDALNLKKLGIVINPDALGNSSYDPLVMLKILVYGYSYGWRSSRKLERALHHNLSFIWLAGSLKPDHKTINNFRKVNKSALGNVLMSCARICMGLNLIECNTLLCDGSKFRANAGSNQSKTKEGWEKIAKKVESRIDTLMNDLDRVDLQETHSLVKMKKELVSKEKLKEKIDKLLDQVEDGKRVNGTDPECKIMKSRQGSHADYNAQIVVDELHGLIVSSDAVSDGNDLNQLANQISQAEETLEKPAENICADAGYSSVDIIKPMVDKNQTVIVPNPKQAEREPKCEPFSKEAFTYDPQTDS